MLSVKRASSLLHLPAGIRPLVTARLNSTQTGLGATGSQPQPKRKTVTPFNDNGRVPWGLLSPGEKLARTTQQSFNFGFMIIGAILTGGVAYFMYTEVFALDSKTNWFNRAVDRVKDDPKVEELLGDSKKITAYGEKTNNKWAVARPIASSQQKDNTGTDHIIMHFNVEGPLNKGVVSLHMTKHPSADSEFEYRYLKLDVKGHPTLYLEGGTANAVGKGQTKLFGVRWR